jgi:capsular polysaccharide transport system permease protein
MVSQAMTAALPDTPRAAPMPQSLKPPRFLSARTITALILREMESTYGRQPGGYIWAVLQPVGMIVLLSMAFSLLVHKPPLGTNFLFFYAISYLPFDIYSTLQGKIGSALSYSRALLFYPRVTWIDTILARFFLNTLTLFTVFFIVTGGLSLMYETRAHISLIPLIQGLSMAAILGLGVGMTNCVLGGLFPVWDTIWAILSRPLFLASGVLFLPEVMPAAVRDALAWNPLIHIIGLVRQGFFPTYENNLVSLTYGYGFGLVLMVFSLIFLRAYYKTILQQ